MVVKAGLQIMFKRLFFFLQIKTTLTKSLTEIQPPAADETIAYESAETTEEIRPDSFLDHGPFVVVPHHGQTCAQGVFTAAVTTTTVITTTATSQATCQTTPSSQCPLVWFASVASSVNRRATTSTSSIGQTTQCSLSWFADVASSQPKVEKELATQTKTISADISQPDKHVDVHADVSTQDESGQHVREASYTRKRSKKQTGENGKNASGVEVFSTQTQTPQNFVVSAYYRRATAQQNQHLSSLISLYCALYW